MEKLTDTEVKQTRNLKKCDQCGNMRSIAAHRDKCEGCRKFSADINAGRIKPPTYTEVNTRNYKDPMQKVDEGFGYYGAVTETNDGEYIQCHICGYYFSSLGGHITNKHKVNVRDYKVKYGLRIKDGLLSPNERRRAQFRYNSGIRKTSEDFKAMSVKAQAAIKAKGISLGGDTWSAQTRNEKGMCRAQTMAKIKALADKMDGVPTQKAFLQEYGQGQSDVVSHWFGSWRGALNEGGFMHFNDNRAKTREERKEKALDSMRKFYDQEGRTPQWTDFNSLDWLPDGKTIQNYFGTLNKARVEAGIPTLVAIGRNWIEVEPGEENINGIVPGTYSRSGGMGLLPTWVTK